MKIILQMLINNKNKLIEGNLYIFYKCQLSQNMTSLRASKPTEYLFCGVDKWCLLFKRVLKSGKLSTKDTKIWYNSISGTFWRKCYDSYAEACELFDRDLEIAKDKLLNNSKKMKELYDAIDSKKINLRKNKLNRLMNEDKKVTKKLK